MTKEELIHHANRISNGMKTNIPGSLVEAKQFLYTYAGPKSLFFKGLDPVNPSGQPSYVQHQTMSVLKSFIVYVENDLLRSISLEREIQIETVSDYLAQAENLLKNNNVHAAAPTVLIGASLEEFLRTWLEEESVDLDAINSTLDSYARELRSRDLINKQDVKDITSWGGIRNDAAHGHWEMVQDRERIKLMLEGVNLFIRKYSK